MHGDIRTELLVVQEGGVFEGRSSTLKDRAAAPPASEATVLAARAAHAGETAGKRSG